ncbi:MAG: MarR family transcriptional regulator [Candidatus Sericytochromatia bacterium]|nr:MarR family transcriptional regulator [Candidatus Sericytochromatia bacterium]
MERSPRDAEKLVGRFAWVVNQWLREDPVEEATAGELTVAQWEVLRYVGLHDPAYAGQLSSGLGISPPAATKAIDRLFAKGLVDRKEDPRDRRQHLLSVTEDGRRRLDEVDQRQQQRLSQVLSRMEPGDRRALFKGLRAFLTSAYGQDNPLVERSCERCGLGCFESCVVHQAHMALYGTPVARV